MEKKTTTDAKNIAVAYYRYSSHRQGEQSIEGQAKAAQKWASERNCMIVREYADRAQTGRNDNREAFQTMLKEIEKIKPNYLICWKVDRIGRNKEEIAFNKYRIKRAGAKIVYVAEDIPESPEGIILESVLEGMAEYYSVQLATNIRRGQRNAAEKCQFIGGSRMFGYISGSDKKYVIDQDRAPIVREIFSRYVSGESQTQIINWLNENGIRTLRGTVFTPNSIRTLLKNEKYTGVYLFNGGEIRIEGGIPAIIDHSTWEKAQEVMIKNQRAPAKREEKENYILTDKLFCGTCGGPMSGVSGTSRSGAKHCYYTCATRHRKSGGNGCTKRNVRKDWIEGKVLELIKKILTDDDILEQIADRCYEAYIADKKDDSYMDSLRVNLKNVENSLQNIMRAIEAGIFNETTKARMDELEAQRRQIVESIEYENASNKVLLTRGQILYFLHKFADLDIDDPKQQQKLIDTFVNAIFVYDDKITTTFNYSGDGSVVTLEEVDSAYVDAAEVFASPASSSTSSSPISHEIGDFSFAWRKKAGVDFRVFAESRTATRTGFGTERIRQHRSEFWLSGAAFFCFAA